jgi:hypothetical protein
MSRQSFRVRTIRRIDRCWDAETESQETGGIRAGLVCQVCGEFGAVRGLSGVIGLRASGDFRHPRCIPGVEEAHRRPTVFCEICRSEVPRDTTAGRVGSWRLCDACLETIRIEAPSREPREVMRRLIHWRYSRMRDRPTPSW